MGFSKGGNYIGGFSSGAFDGDGEFNIHHPNDDWEYFKGQYESGYRKSGSYQLSTGDQYDGHGKFTWGPDNYFEGEFSNGEMTGTGLYYVAGGGLYDSSEGLYFPNSADKSENYEAQFDGKTLRYKKPPVVAKGKKG